MSFTVHELHNQLYPKAKRTQAARQRWKQPVVSVRVNDCRVEMQCADGVWFVTQFKQESPTLLYQRLVALGITQLGDT